MLFVGSLFTVAGCRPWRGWLGDPGAPSFSHGFAVGYMTSPALRAFSRMRPWPSAKGPG